MKELDKSDKIILLTFYRVSDVAWNTLEKLLIGKKYSAQLCRCNA